MDSVAFVVSKHALARYRERIDPGADREKLALAALAAGPAPAWVRKCLPGDAGSRELLADKTAVFVLIARGPGAPADFLVTVIPLNWLEQTYRTYGKKRVKVHCAKWKKPRRYYR